MYSAVNVLYLIMLVYLKRKDVMLKRKLENHGIKILSCHSYMIYTLSCVLIIIDGIIIEQELKYDVINPLTTEDLDAADPKEQKFSIELTEGLDHVNFKRFKLYHVDENCDLGSFMAKCDVPYRIGSVYYQFSRDEEDISEDKEIILMNNEVMNILIIVEVNTLTMDYVM